MKQIEIHEKWQSKSDDNSSLKEGYYHWKISKYQNMIKDMLEFIGNMKEIIFILGELIL